MDLYSLLGVPVGASADEIESGYRRAVADIGQHESFSLIQRWRMRRVERAYALLRDAKKRHLYDTTPSLSEMIGRCPPGLL